MILERRANNAGAVVEIAGLSVAAGAEGAYLLTGVPSGSQTITIRRQSYLRTWRLVPVTAGQTTVLPDATLLGGDVNGDDMIEVADGNLIAQAWNGTPDDTRWDPRADVTDDGQINILDRVAVQVNWDKAAPGPWPGAGQSGAWAHRAPPPRQVPAAAGAAAQVIISPTLTSLASAGETAEVDIWVQDVRDLYSARVQLSFDPSVLQIQDTDPRASAPGVQIIPGEFLDPMNQQVLFNLADNTAGTIDFAVTLAYPATAQSGSGVLATIVLEAADLGSSPLHLEQARLLDDSWPDPEEIPAGMQDGQVNVGGGGFIYLPLVRKNAAP